MKKQQKYTLELDDDLPEMDDVALLFFHTSVPGYAFVDDMNRLFRLSLSRQADLKMHEHQWPLYRYREAMTKLTYLVLERPAGSGGTAPHWAEGNKLMIIQGEMADMQAKQIMDEFGRQPEASPYDTPANEERRNILSGYQQVLMPVSRFVPGEMADATMPRKAAKERAELESLVYDLMDCLDLQGQR